MKNGQLSPFDARATSDVYGRHDNMGQVDMGNIQSTLFTIMMISITQCKYICFFETSFENTTLLLSKLVIPLSDQRDAEAIDYREAFSLSAREKIYY